MSKRASLISLFVLLNMAIGRMFQESLGATCFSELFIIAITSFFFWNVSAQQIKKWGNKWTISSSGNNMLIQSGLGLSVSALNIIIGHILAALLMTVVYQRTSPSFDVLNASLTNNIAVNLLCYFLLLLFLVDSKKGEIPTTTPSKNIAYNNRIAVSKKGFQFLLSPEEVIYVETSNNCIILHTKKGRFVKYQSLKTFSKNLCPNTFKRVHRSYLVNSDLIERIQKNHNGDGVLHLKTGDDIKFSRTYLNTITNT
ncbi:LytR/AlgR family response regulator transcription factor [Flagellimonas aquimarina]|nr:LytTR family DNA-binding domain-containing protein [Allomuricauda koreensis]